MAHITTCMHSLASWACYRSGVFGLGAGVDKLGGLPVCHATAARKGSMRTNGGAGAEPSIGIPLEAVAGQEKIAPVANDGSMVKCASRDESS